MPASLLSSPRSTPPFPFPREKLKKDLVKTNTLDSPWFSFDSFWHETALRLRQCPPHLSPFPSENILGNRCEPSRLSLSKPKAPYVEDPACRRSRTSKIPYFSRERSHSGRRSRIRVPDSACRRSRMAKPIGNEGPACTEESEGKIEKGLPLRLARNDALTALSGGNTLKPHVTGGPDVVRQRIRKREGPW